MQNDPANVEITALAVYPVKSMRGIALERAALTPLGIEHDRRFMVVRADGTFVTQRDTPAMALIETAIEADGLLLSREGRGFVRVPFETRGGKRVETRVWKDTCVTADQGDVISRWLTEALESAERLRLVAMAPAFERPQGKPGLLGAATRTLFADAAPYLVTNEASLDALNTKLREKGEAAVPMNRFRPNIVVRGLPAFAEHSTSLLRGDHCELKLRYPCERCIVTTIDQHTAVKNPAFEPYRSLAELNPAPGRASKPAFGQNATLANTGPVTVGVGDRLRVVQTIS
jgi:uncharacterized protein YcbX